MTLFLNEEEVDELLTMKEALAAVEDCFKQQAAGKALNVPRTRARVPGSVLNVMSASLPYLGRSGLKCYQATRTGTRFLLVLFGAEPNEPLAVMGAEHLGRYRTGAASAIATKYCAEENFFTFGISGSGNQALTQVLAMAEVAELEKVKVWSPSRTHRSSFLKVLADRGIDAEASRTLEEAFGSAQVATTITSAGSPYIGGEAVKGLVHINVCGSNSPDRAELTPAAVGAFSTLVVDDLAQAKMESGDLIGAEAKGLISWRGVVELKDVVARKRRVGRRTLFKSNGVAIEDVAVASLVYDKAMKRGGFQEVDLGRGPR